MENAAGEVCGAFSHAVYCTFGKEVLLLHGREWGEVPFGIALPDIVAFRAAVPAEVGDAVTLPQTDCASGGGFCPAR